MGRPKLEKPLSNAERKRKWRELNKEKEKEADRKRKEEKRQKLTIEEKEEIREKNKQYKQKSREKQKETESRQKQLGRLVKDRNRKKKEYNKKNIPSESTSKSTERVQKHREKIRMSFITPKERKSLASRTEREKLTNIKKNFAKIASPRKKASVIQNLIPSQSPQSKKVINENILPETYVDAGEVMKSLSKRRDKSSNISRRIFLSEIIKQKPVDSTSNFISSNFHTSANLIKVLEKISLDDLLAHAKLLQPNHGIKSTVVDKVLDFYNRDDVSRVVPHKNATILIQDKNGIRQRVCLRILEKTLKKLYELFCQENPTVVISRRKFEMIRPKNVRLRKYAQRMVCCCVLHTNIDYLRQSGLRYVKMSDLDEESFDSNEALGKSLVCDNYDVECLLRKCDKCKIKKVKNIENLKCSRECKLANNNCFNSGHSVQFRQFDRVSYEHAGKAKKKLSLQNYDTTLSKFDEILNEKLNPFLLHRFNVIHTKEMLQHLFSTLRPNEIVLIQDFSENYTCLLPDEPQSIHWTQQTVTVYPVVALKNERNKISEDHFVFISDSKEHNAAFVEYCTNILRQYYSDLNPKFIEITDGCAEQFKSIKAISALAKRDYNVTRIYFETSHGKSKSDGLGGVIKSFVTQAVASEKFVIRNATELFEFCEKYLVIDNKEDAVVKNRKFYLIHPTDLVVLADKIKNCKFKTVPGTQKIHQICNKVPLKSGIFIRNFICTCIPCRDNDFQKCQLKESQFFTASCSKFENHLQYISYKWITFKQKAVKDGEESESDDEEEEDEDINENTTRNSDISDMLKAGEIAVIKADDPIHFFYLLKITKEPFSPEEYKDEYGHTYHSNSIVLGSYLEITYEDSLVTKYYVDKRTAAVSVNAIIGLCPPLKEVQVVFKRKTIKGLEMDYELCEGLKELCDMV